MKNIIICILAIIVMASCEKEEPLKIENYIEGEYFRKDSGINASGVKIVIYNKCVFKEDTLSQYESQTCDGKYMPKLEKMIYKIQNDTLYLKNIKLNVWMNYKEIHIKGDTIFNNGWFNKFIKKDPCLK